MPFQLIALLQLTGLFSLFLGAYLWLLEYLMPTPTKKTLHTCNESGS